MAGGNLAQMLVSPSLQVGGENFWLFVNICILIYLLLRVKQRQKSNGDDAPLFDKVD